MKSPIRSPLQSKSLRTLKVLIPEGSKVSSFMLYAGDLELALADSDRVVTAHTPKQVIYEFWSALKKDKERVVSAVDEFYPQLDSLLFHYLQESWPQIGDPYMRAAFFFILNRCSEAGEISTGRLSPKRFNPVSVAYLKNFKGVNFYPRWDKEENPLSALPTAKDADFVLFPVGKFNFNLFEYGKSRGHEMISLNHRELHERMRKTDNKMILIYKPHPQLWRMYAGYNIHMIDKYGRTASNRDNCEELIIANF